MLEIPGFTSTRIIPMQFEIPVSLNTHILKKTLQHVHSFTNFVFIVNKL